MSKRIACFGDNCVDSYGETGQIFPGGNPVNVAAYVRRLGERASYVGPVGKDANGKFLLNALGSRGVDVSHVRTEEGSTAVTHIRIVNGERTFSGYDEGVMADYRPSEEEIVFIAEHDLAVTGLWGHSESALEAIRQRGVRKRPFQRPPGPRSPTRPSSSSPTTKAGRTRSGKSSGNSAPWDRKSSSPPGAAAGASLTTAGNFTPRGSCPARSSTPWARGTAISRDSLSPGSGAFPSGTA